MRKRKQFLRLVDAILAGEIEQVVLAHQDRLARYVITITHCFSSQLYGLRNYRRALEEAIKDDQSAQDQIAADA